MAKLFQNGSYQINKNIIEALIRVSEDLKEHHKQYGKLTDEADKQKNMANAVAFSEYCLKSAVEMAEPNTPVYFVSDNPAKLPDEYYYIKGIDGSLFYRNLFKGQEGQFTVNIAKIKNNSVVASAFTAPVFDELYYTSGDWKGTRCVNMIKFNKERSNTKNIMPNPQKDTCVFVDDRGEIYTYKDGDKVTNVDRQFLELKNFSFTKPRSEASVLIFADVMTGGMGFNMPKNNFFINGEFSCAMPMLEITGADIISKDSHRPFTFTKLHYASEEIGKLKVIPNIKYCGNMQTLTQQKIAENKKHSRS